MVGIRIVKQFPSRITLKQGTYHEEPKMAFGAQLFQNAWRPFSEGAWIMDIRRLSRFAAMLDYFNLTVYDASSSLSPKQDGACLIKMHSLTLTG